MKIKKTKVKRALLMNKIVFFSFFTHPFYKMPRGQPHIRDEWIAR